jgi:adenylyltransferase/sulfurtransferase
MSMKPFSFSRVPFDVAAAQRELADPACGGYVAFEGWVRNHNEGLPVTHLEYEAFEPLGVKEGERIVAEAKARFGIEHALCIHRIGDLAIGDLAVWVGVSARHRGEAFDACRYIIDEVKHRVPIWKKEHYVNGDSGWVNCERCATAPQLSRETGAQTQEHSHGGGRDHDHDHDMRHDHSHAAHDHGAHASGASTGAPLVADYSRQLVLKEVGVAGQAKLRAARVLVVGAGGLGVPVLSYLAGAGVGRLGIVDGDRLDPSNLHRQTLYGLADSGRPKAELAAARLRALNPEVDVVVHGLRLDASNGEQLIAGYDLVVDCTDNFGTKFLLNDLCNRLGKPAVFASVYQYEGQLQVLRPERRGACLRCVWPEATRDGLVGNCAEAGVLGPVPGVFGSLQALEALKILLGLPGQLGDELLVLDLLSLATRRVRIRRDPACSGRACVRAAARGEVPAAGIEVEFDSLDEAVDRGYLVIDIRESSELAAQPTPASRSRHVPVGELLHGAGAPDPGTRWLLVCARGSRSLAAATALRERGLADVYSLRGGLIALLQRADG